jgi:hypothetical protein
VHNALETTELRLDLHDQLADRVFPGDINSAVLDPGTQAAQVLKLGLALGCPCALVKSGSASENDGCLPGLAGDFPGKQ